MEKDDHFVKFSSWTIASVEKKHSKVCDYRFFQKSSNNTHVISVHEGKKPFKCDIFDRRWSRKSSMNVASIHEGKNTLKCDICDYRCPQKGDMNKYIALVHEAKKPFKCDICDYRLRPFK